MKRPLRPEEVRLWATVVSTVRPALGRTRPAVPPGPPPSSAPTAPLALLPRAQPRVPRQPSPEPIEPGRKRRIARERDPIERRLDLHGMDQDQARAALHGFLARAYESGIRAVLVITGKGVRGDGVLRRRVPEWLAEAPSRPIVAGIAPADRRHGGDGALYVHLRRLR